MEGDGDRLPPNCTGRISIHALRVEGDVPLCSERSMPFISIHALRVEGDGDRLPPNCTGRISIHALRVEGDVRVYETVTTDREISIHALRVEGD